MRLGICLLLLAGCGGAPFTAAQPDLLERDGAPDAAGPEGGPDGGDGGGEGDGLADGDGGQVEGGRDAVPEGGQDAAPEAACTLVTHTDGIAQTWQDCAPAGTYNQAEATAACEANGGAQCVVNNCAGSGSTAICDVSPWTAGYCNCWVFSGPLVGNVNIQGGCTNALQASCDSNPPYTWR